MEPEGVHASSSRHAANLRVDGVESPHSASSHSFSRPQSREALPGSRPASRPTTREGQGGRNRVPSSGRQAARHLLQDAGGAQAASSVERTPASRRKESLAASMDVARGPGGKEKSKSMSNDEIIEQLGRGKKKSENMTAAIRDSLRQMTAMMDDHDAEKEPVANLRDSMPAQLEKLNEAWLQTDDLGAVRQAMDEEADAQNVARYEDEYSVISRCRFKYNPVHELRRYIPAVGVRALLTNRGVAVEILGDPMNIEDAKLWKRRIRIISSQASCGPMDRPSRNRQIVASSFSHPSPAVSGFFNRRKTMAVRACVVHAV